MLFAALSLFSCDTIKEGDRFDPVDPGESRKVVLLEDFSGVKCVNCPAATKTADNLLKLYPDNLVVLVLHGKNSGGYGDPFDGEQDFRLPEVAELFEAMGGDNNPGYIGYPFGMVNREIVGNSEFLATDKWATRVSEELQKPQALDIVISKLPTYSEDDDKVEVKVDVKTIGELPAGSYSLVIQVSESGIKGSQLLGDGSVNKEYKHKHVLRSFVNGTWGESIAIPVSGNTISKNFTIELDEKWEKDNCSIVAYVYNSETKRSIVQAAILPISNNGGSGTLEPKIEMDKAAAYLSEGATEQLTATLTDTTGVIDWSSDDESIVSVVDGMITAIAEGATYVNATCGGLSAKCKVTVVATDGDFNIFKKEGDGLVALSGDTSITLNLVETSAIYTDGVVFFKGVIFNNLSVQKKIVMRVTRTNHELLADEGCIGFNCIPSNGEQIQDFKGNVPPNGSNTFDFYFKPKDKTVAGTYNIVHEFFEEGNESNKITVNVTYEWAPPLP